MDKQPVVMSEFDKLIQEERQIIVKGVMQSIEQILEEKFNESLERVTH